jgi:hypothetical protein
MVWCFRDCARVLWLRRHHGESRMKYLLFEIYFAGFAEINEHAPCLTPLTAVFRTTCDFSLGVVLFLDLAAEQKLEATSSLVHVADRSID